MWGDVVRAVLPRLQNDATLSELLGGPHIYKAKTLATIRTPGVYYSVVSTITTENYAPVVLQWDVWAQSAVAVEAIELRLFQLMHSDTPVEFNGLRMWSQVVEGHDDDDEQGISRRSLEYRYTPARLNG